MPQMPRVLAQPCTSTSAGSPAPRISYRMATPSALDQFRVWLENTKHFVVMGNLFPVELAPPRDLGQVP